MQRWLRALIFCAVPFCFWSVTAIPAWADQRWEGSGRVVRGAGNGASVPKLQLKTDDNTREWVVFLSGPDAGQRVQLTNNSSVKTASGVWHFSSGNRRLEAKFYQDEPYRVIRYRLRPSN
ncbi:MAG: hypothetical protein GVY17_08780 [Cyanobacteria bacterium]|jgi:hypothetical protein|nr:hypothetical protein [Cyanobacteria bacterium GSL.Bin21]